MMTTMKKRSVNARNWPRRRSKIKALAPAFETSSALTTHQPLRRSIRRQGRSSSCWKARTKLRTRKGTGFTSTSLQPLEAASKPKNRKVRVIFNAHSDCVQCFVVDTLDKTIDLFQKHVLHEGDQSNESAREQAKDHAVSISLRIRLYLMMTRRPRLRNLFAS